MHSQTQEQAQTHTFYHKYPPLCSGSLLRTTPSFILLNNVVKLKTMFLPRSGEFCLYRFNNVTLASFIISLNRLDGIFYLKASPLHTSLLLQH